MRLSDGDAPPAPMTPDAAWEKYVRLAERAADLGLLVGGPSGADVAWGGAAADAQGSVLRLPGGCVGKATRDTNGPVSQQVQTSTGCFLEPASDGHFLSSDTLGEIKSLVECAPPPPPPTPSPNPPTRA